VERFGFFGFARKSARGENAAFMGGVERRGAIGVSFGEREAAIGNHAVDVKNCPGNKLLEQVKGLLIAELVEPATTGRGNESSSCRCRRLANEA